MVVNESDSMVRIFGADDTKRKGAMIAISRDAPSSATEIVIATGMEESKVVMVERRPDDWREAVRMPVRLQ
jgi:hypothetical protein